MATMSPVESTNTKAASEVDPKADPEVVVESKPSTSGSTSKFQGGKMVINRMSAPATSRTGTPLTSGDPLKINPRKRLAALVGSHTGTQTTEPKDDLPATSSGAKKRKLSTRDDGELELENRQDEHQSTNSKEDKVKDAQTTYRRSKRLAAKKANA